MPFRTLSTIFLSMAFLLIAPQANASFETAAELYKANNFPAAFTAFTKLAEAGDARAQTVLALMYKYGEGTEVDNKKAFKWYQTAAEQGYAPAQFHTGSLYADGLENDIDLQKAEFWFSKAAKQGFTRAHDKLAQINPGSANNGEIKAWSKEWDLRLPVNYRLDTDPAEPVKLDNRYRVQVGAMLSQTAANRLWTSLAQAHPVLFKDFQPAFSLSQDPKRQVYRIQTGPFASFREARNFCDTLLGKTLNAGCLVIK